MNALQAPSLALDRGGWILSGGCMTRGPEELCLLQKYGEVLVDRFVPSAFVPAMRGLSATRRTTPK